MGGAGISYKTLSSGGTWGAPCTGGGGGDSVFSDVGVASKTCMCKGVIFNSDLQASFKVLQAECFFGCVCFPQAAVDSLKTRSIGEKARILMGFQALGLIAPKLLPPLSLSQCPIHPLGLLAHSHTLESPAEIGPDTGSFHQRVWLMGCAGPGHPSFKSCPDDSDGRLGLRTSLRYQEPQSLPTPSRVPRSVSEPVPEGQVMKVLTAPAATFILKS